MRSSRLPRSTFGIRRIGTASDPAEAARLGVAEGERPRDTVGEIAQRAAMAQRIYGKYARPSLSVIPGGRLGTAVSRASLAQFPFITGGFANVRPAAGAGGVNVTANTVVNVSGAGDPNATAQRVADAQSRVHADVIRNTRAVAR